ncbi:hypothetical protein BOX15_Mlig005228g5, partial [Macrostomum lignano]
PGCRRRMLKWLEKQRSVWRARHRCQTRARPHTVCLLCCRVIRAWGAVGLGQSELCHPMTCPDHFCHINCMLAYIGRSDPVSGSRCPTCGRIFRELCFHKIRAGRPCGQCPLDELDCEPAGAAAAAAATGLWWLLPAPFEYDSDDGGGGASGGASESGGTGRQLPAAATVADRDASTGGELRLATYMLDIGSDCAICCDRIESDVGVPDACCHQYCFACLARWCQTSPTCPIDRRPLGHIYIRPRPGAPFASRVGVGDCAYSEYVPHFSEQLAAAVAGAAGADAAASTAPGNAPGNREHPAGSASASSSASSGSASPSSAAAR